MKKVFSVLVLLGTFFFAGAQGSAAIEGKVADGSGFLPGVTITVKDSPKGAVTDLEGRFRIENLATGNTALLISYIGYSTKEVSFQLTAGLNAIGTIQLQEVQESLQEVVIKGTMAPSQMKALSIKKNALGIMEVIAADAIGKLPDRNAAEAVQRLQGVSVARYHGEADQATVRGTPFAWTSTLFNGTRTPSASVYGSRNSILDAVPSEIIQYVQLSKAITPDMEGDAIGGSINFVMRTAPEKRTLNISGAGGYNQRSENGTYNASLVYGDRFFKNKLGVIVAASIWDRNWATDELAIAYNTNLAAPAAGEQLDPRYSVNTMNAKRYFGKRRTYGLNAGMEYNFNATNKVYARLLADKFDDIRPVYESFYDFPRNRYRFSYRYSYYETNINGVEVGGNHQIHPKVKLEWRVSDYEMQFAINTPPNFASKGLPIAQFNQGLTGKFGNLASDNRKYLNIDTPDGSGDPATNIQPYLTNPEADALLDPNKLRLSQLTIFQLNQREEDLVGQLDFTISASDKFSLKIGGKYRTKERFGQQTPLVFIPGAALGVPNSPALVTLNNLQTEGFPLPGNFFSEINQPFNNLIASPISKQQLFDIFTDGFFATNGLVEVSPFTNPTTIQTGTEDVAAGYIMGVYDLTSKIKLIGGVRNEYTQLEMVGKSADTKNKVITDITRNNNYNAFLPMFHLKYSPKEQANIRLAYTKTFIRPSFGELNPSETVDLTGTVPKISRGNIDLNPTFSNNFDLMGEYFFQNIGLVSGGVFHKSITDIVFTDIANETIDATNYLVTQPKNLQKSSLTGFEIGITRRFSKLPGILSGFGVELNYTNVQSGVDVPRVDATGVTITERATLPNQSKHMWNAILFYERNGLSLRLASNFRGKSVETFAQQLGPNFYIWSDDNLTVDFSGSYTITKGLRAFVEVNNLTNSYVGLYMGNNKERITSREWYSIRGQVGLKFDIF